MSERLNSDRLNNDFQFIEVGRKDPKKKLLRQRKREFVEIHDPVSYTHLRAHETGRNLVCRLLLEKKKKKDKHNSLKCHNT